MSQVRRKLITDAVLTHLGLLDTVLQPLEVFRSEVDKPLPVLANSDRVGRYAVVYPFGGTPGPDTDLAITGGDLDYGFQVNCAAGFETDAEFLVDQVYAQFFGWIPTVTGLVFGTFRPPPGYQPGPVRRNDQVKPPRFWLPLQFQIVATTTSA